MDLIDLHVHSTCSDGTCTPAELVELARAAGLSAFALTDHDTILGIPAALAAAAGTPLEIVPGIEFSTEYRGKDIHIVGLDIPWQDPSFTGPLERFLDSRNTRNDRIIAKMQAAGIPVSRKELENSFGDAVLTRAHFARYLAEHGYAPDLSAAFQKYMSPGGPFYVPREKVTPMQAVSLVHKANGIPVLAHPMLYGMSEAELDGLLEDLKKEGLIGIEALYSTHSPQQEELVRRLAARHGLKISGGSDFHGENKPDIHIGVGRGNLSIPACILSDLRDSV